MLQNISWPKETPMLFSANAASAPMKLPPNTLDISAVPVIRSKSHLPIIVDPSHATGVRAYVAPLAKCAIAAGADGIMVEAHNNPTYALSDGPQSLTLPQFDELAKMLDAYAKLEGREFL